MLDDLIRETRSYRSFTDKKISIEELTSMIEAARFAGATKNLQGVRYVLITNDKTCNEIFKYTAWAGAIDWNPTVDEAPKAYIALYKDNKIDIIEKYLYFDMGLASQNILLKATEMGYGGCVLGAYNRVKVSEIIGEVDGSIELLIALGEPNQKIVLEDTDNDTTYYRDEDGNHHVPKRRLEDLIKKEI